MGKRQPKILTFEEMQALTTPRLLAYKQSLYKVPEGPNHEETMYGGKDHRLHKLHPDWKVAVAAVKAVLAQREHVEKRSMAEAPKTITLRCERVVPDKPNMNGNIYPREVLQKMADQAQEDVHARRLMGRVGTSAGPMRMSDASHIVTRLETDKDGHLVADLEVLNTERGKELQRMIEGMGVHRMEIIPCGVGSVETLDGNMRRVMGDYNLKAIDVVAKLNAYEETPQLGRTTKIRVPVVVDESGNCYSVGWANAQKKPGYSDDYEDMQEQAYECHSTSFPEAQTRVTRWATIEVPIPESETEIEGTSLAAEETAD